MRQTQQIIKFRHLTAQCPCAILPFLTAEGSLTALLEMKAGRALVVKVLQENIVPLTVEQKQLLRLPVCKPMLAKVREVLLYGNEDKAWVRAISVFPLCFLRGEAKRLKHLKTTPIGYVLFKKTKKLPFVRTIYCNQHWARRTVYDWYGRKFLIEERFLMDEF